MKTLDIALIKKYVKKEYKDWTEQQIELKSYQILESYLEANKEKIEKENCEIEKNLEIVLDKEFIELYLDSKTKQ